MPYVDSNLSDYVQNEIPLATLQEMVNAGTVPPNQVFLTPESEDVGMTNVYVNDTLQETLSFDRDPQTQITENKTNIDKKLEPSNIKAGANITVTTSGNDVTISAVAEAGGTVVNVNGVKQDIINFTSDPQTQIDAKFNSSNVVQSTGSSTTQVMSQNAVTTNLNNKATVFAQSAYNCNACYNAGIYLVANGSNCPSGSQYGSLFVMPYRKATGNTTPDFAVQIYLPNGDDSTKPNSMFYRTSVSGAWNSWKEIMNLSDDQMVAGAKNFTGTFKINGGTVAYNSSTDTFTI